MNVKVTWEVASAHRNLEKLCEQFETSVDEFCASPLQIRPHEFYDCECIPIAAACAKAHTEFPDVCAYEVEAYGKEIARSEKALNQQTSELKKNKTQMTTAYEYDVAEAEKAFQQHQLRLEKTAVQSITTVQSKVEELSEVAAKVDVKISDFTDRDAKELLENNHVGSDAEISFRKALREAKRQEHFSVASHVWMFIVGAVISWFVFSLFHPDGAIPVLAGVIPPVAVSIISAVIAITFFVFETTRYTKKKARVAVTLKELISAAEGECIVIRNEMQNEVNKADSVRQQKVNEADSKKVDDDIQDTEIAVNTLATHEKNVENASARRDQAIAYIEREYQMFDERLGQCLDKFQSAINTWSTKHASVTAMLDKNSVQSSNENTKQIASHFTRVGTIGIWDTNVVSEIRVGKTKEIAPDTAIESVERGAIEEKELSSIDRYRRDAENGDSEAQYELGLSYIYGIGVEENIAEGVKWFQKAAEQGKTEAQFNLAIAYADGRGIQQNSVEASKWFQKAADQEDAASQYFLGTMYNHGDGVRQDYDEAIKWYLKAAEQEYPDAMCNLGRMYVNGEGVQQDYGEAVRWFQKAVELEHAQSQFNLGLMYEKGTGIRKDEVKAVQWYKKSADQEFHLAQYNLGVMYINGTGVTQDYIEASKWIQKAADQDFAEALFLLGVMYENGEGVRKNNMKAINLYRRAAKQGNEEAIEALRDIEGSR